MIEDPPGSGNFKSALWQGDIILYDIRKKISLLQNENLFAEFKKSRQADLIFKDDKFIIRLHGSALKLSGGFDSFSTNFKPTLLEYLYNNQRLALFWSAIVFLFGIIWSLAIFFITLKSIFFSKISVLMSNISFLLMGWIIVFLIGPIYTQLGMGAISLLVAGGLCYTAGALIFANGKPNPFPPYFGNHEIWHVCVLAGNTFMFLVMLFYVLPYPTG